MWILETCLSKGIIYCIIGSALQQYLNSTMCIEQKQVVSEEEAESDPGTVQYVLEGPTAANLIDKHSSKSSNA